MPFEETTTAAAAGSMLGNEYRMTSHRCLLAVIGNHCWSKTFGNEILRMLTDGSQSLSAIYSLSFFERWKRLRKADPESLSNRSVKSYSLSEEVWFSLLSEETESF